MTVIVETLEMLGMAGYARAGKPTCQDIAELIQRQRAVRTTLCELDEEALIPSAGRCQGFSENSAGGGLAEIYGGRSAS